MEKQMILIRGLPGSGKSTLARKLTADMNLRVTDGTAERHIEADQYFMVDGEYKFDPTKLGHAHTWAQNEAATSCFVGSPLVVIANTFTTRKEMAPYIKIAERHGYAVSIIKMENDFGSIHNVPESAIARMKARWQEV